MKNKILIIFIVLGNIVFTECIDSDNELDCNYNDSCIWIENMTNWNCSNLSNSESCISYSEYGCSWEFAWGGWQNYGSYCAGGSFQIDNGYCQEISLPNCSDLLTESNCNHLEECEWIGVEVDCEDLNSESNCNSYGCDWTVDLSNISCSGITTENCNIYDGCYIDQDCNQWGSWYTWICYDYGPQYCTGTYGIDSSYCDGENGYCQEQSWDTFGDVNFDGIINIQDVIQVIDIILNNQYNNLADMNSDGVVNIIDVLQIINIILNG